jgi:arginyl-tRNA--protein-N-Asp/Glu arginylyltransferase
MNEHRQVSGLLVTAQAEYDALRFVSPEAPCPYLPGRLARHEVYRADQLEPASYDRLLARGFRRSGRVVYRPRCRGCAECRQIRILVDEFRPSTSQRRVLRRNADLRVKVDRPELDDAKVNLFHRYLDAQHDGSMSRGKESLREFLYDSPTDSFEFQYWLGSRLAGVSIADRVPSGLSSVYMYFDPELSSRSLGTYSVLWEIDYCRREKLPYYYLGYYVAGCTTMNYKARFRPLEVLIGEDRWLSLRVGGGA